MNSSTSKRTIRKFKPDFFDIFINKTLRWATQFSHFAYYCPNKHQYLHGAFKHFLAAGAISLLDLNKERSFDNLKNFHNATQDWLIGNFTYDLKNEIENLSSDNPDDINFEGINFFQPETLIFFDEEYVEIHSFEDPFSIFQSISETNPELGADFDNKTLLTGRTTRHKYIETVDRIREEIINGEVYELNYCIEFSGKNTNFDPLEGFKRLSKVSPMPFATFQKIEDRYLICASPERFLKKEGNSLTSQPIKGTIRRGNTQSEDALLETELQNSEKERAENMMIVDLVRNDLAKSAVPGTTKVEELFGIYSYQHIHQMVSTIVAEAKPEIHFTDIIRNAFPMGSMTGAPKISAMKLIEQLEESKRGLFSGAAGYITPDGDFDFNVIIRSLLYDRSSGNLSFHVGSAITYDAVPEHEYEECLLKAAALLNILQ